MSWTGIQAEIRSFGSRHGTHIHEFAQAIFPLTGTMEIEIAGSVNLLSPTMAIIVKPGARHDFEASQNSEFLVVDFDDSALLDLLPLGASCSTMPMGDQSHWRYLQFLAKELRSFPGDSSNRRFLFDTMIKMSANHASQALETASKDRKINYLTMLMERGPEIPSSVASVAKEVGMSERSLRRFFVKNLGLSPKAVQLERRFHQAKILLCSTDLSVAEITYQIGYENPSSFLHAFKRRFGMTPRQYRLSEKSIS